MSAFRKLIRFFCGAGETFGDMRNWDTHIWGSDTFKWAFLRSVELNELAPGIVSTKNGPGYLKMGV